MADAMRGGPCNHGRCPPGDCRMLTEEALRPSEADLELGRRLVAEGWLGVSTRHREVARLRDPWPGLEIIDPRWREHPYGLYVERHFSHLRNSVLRSFASGGPVRDLVEVRELTLRQWRAFKLAGGQPA